MITQTPHLIVKILAKMRMIYSGGNITLNENIWIATNSDPSNVVNTLRPRQNGCRFADCRLEWSFVNENVWIPIKILLKFVPYWPVNDIPVLVQVMAWRRPGDKPLSEPMMVRLSACICITRPHWVKTNPESWINIIVENYEMGRYRLVSQALSKLTYH